MTICPLPLYSTVPPCSVSLIGEELASPFMIRAPPEYSIVPKFSREYVTVSAFEARVTEESCVVFVEVPMTSEFSVIPAASTVGYFSTSSGIKTFAPKDCFSAIPGASPKSQLESLDQASSVPIQL